MAEVLTQSQIDALLSSAFQQQDLPDKDEDASADNKEPEKKYRKYDFYSPKKFTKDKLKLLSNIHESYARLVSSRLNGLLRVTSEIEVSTVEEQRYYEFMNALGEHDILTMVNAHLPDTDENSHVLMLISTQLMLSMIDRILGGTGDGVDSGYGYSYTDLELSLYHNIMKHVTGVMKDGWRNYLDIEFDTPRVETDPSMIQSISREEIVVIIVLEVRFRDTDGQINICIPASLLSAAFQVFDKRTAEANKGNVRENETEEIMESIKDSQLEIKAQLGEAQLLLSDIYNLHVGDVINLNKPKDSEIYLYIEDKPWFKGKLGMHNKNMAVKINGVLENQ